MSNPLTTKEKLVELFNAQLAASGIDTEYTEEDLVFSAPVAYEPGTFDANEPEAANTSIVVTAGTGLEQIVYRLHYCRLSLARLFAPRAQTIALEDAPTTAHSAIDEVSELIEFELTTADVAATAVANNRLTYTALAASLSVVGSASIAYTVEP